MKNIEEKYKVLSHIDHILLRPQTYLGSNKPHTTNRWLLDDNEKMERVEITYVPSFLKIFDEIITNSVDEHKRNPLLNKIEININKESGRITIKDSGGIPVIIHKDHGKYVPEVIFGNLMSSSNYDDSEDRLVAGVNGLGGKLTNVFSKEFYISTCDGKNWFKQTFTNNMKDRTTPIIKKSKLNHTEISYLPDYEKFGLSGIDESHFKLIRKRVIDVAGCNPNIKIYFNNDEIKIKSFEDYIKLYRDEYFYENNKDKTWFIGIAPSDNGFQQVSFVNNTDTYDGGTHIDYILNQIISTLREFFKKKYKVEVKPSDLKNHISLFLNITIINPSFSSQTKEKLITEVKDYGFKYEITEKTIKSILKSEIVNSILDWVDKKKLADESKLARDLNKNLSKIKVDKLIDAKSKDRWKCSIGIYEGDSAASSFRKYRDSNLMGAFSLKGKFLNVSDISTKKLIENNEALNLMAALGLKLGQEPDLKTLRYGRILFYCDSDTDGNSIVGLLINFFYKYWPVLFEKNMIYKVETPIVVSINKKNKKNKILFYKQDLYNEWYKTENINNWEIKYKKGLAALLDDEYDEIINNPKLTLIKKDELSGEYLDIWFGKSSELRKNQIIN